MQQHDDPSAQPADHPLPATLRAPGADSAAKATVERSPTTPQAHPHMAHGPPGAPDAPASHHGRHSGAHGHAGHGEEMFKRPFWVDSILIIPILVYAEHIQLLLGYTAPAFPGSRWLEPLLASVIYWYSGWVFLRGAIAELRARQPGMMTLVALAITTAYYYSLAATFGVVAGTPFYWELATLVMIMLLGHWLEMRAVGSAQSALGELAKLLPDTADLSDQRGDHHVVHSGPLSHPQLSRLEKHV